MSTTTKATLTKRISFEEASDYSMKKGKAAIEELTTRLAVALDNINTKNLVYAGLGLAISKGAEIAGIDVIAKGAKTISVSILVWEAGKFAKKAMSVNDEDVERLLEKINSQSTNQSTTASAKRAKRIPKPVEADDILEEETK